MRISDWSSDVCSSDLTGQEKISPSTSSGRTEIIMADSGIEQIMRLAPVIPVIVIDRVEDAVPMAEALVAGGLTVLEVTMRTPAALDAIAAMKKVPGAVVGAGTVLNPRMLKIGRAHV